MVKAATASELRTKKTKELIAQVGELRTELLALRVAQVSNGAASKLAKISVVRKSIARVLTVINAKARSEMRNQVKGKRTVQASAAAAAAPSSPRRAAPRRARHRRTLRAIAPSFRATADPEAAAREEDARHSAPPDAGAGALRGARAPAPFPRRSRAWRRPPGGLCAASCGNGARQGCRARSNARAARRRLRALLVSCAAPSRATSPRPRSSRGASPPQSETKTDKAATKASNFPPRKYALKA